MNSLREKYEKYGLTLRELAAGSVHSRDTIATRMKAAGVSLKASGARKRINHGVLTYSLDKLVTLVKIKRNAGLSYRAITIYLNGKKIALTDREIRWHPMMVKRLLDKELSKKQRSDD